MSELKGRFQLASADIVCEEFDGEMVVLNLASGHYFAVNQSGSTLLRAVLQGIAPNALSAIDGAQISANDASQFFGDLVAHNLLAADASQAAASLDSTTCAAIKQLADKPALEIHEDLADLIIADPIHDADQATGWPVQKAA